MLFRSDNQKKVLFSPVGSTDPISGEYDGALLHIIRKYRSRKVYLYLLKEICEFEDKDSRYSYCFDRLKEHLGYDFETEWIRRENRDVSVLESGVECGAGICGCGYITVLLQSTLFTRISAGDVS